MSAAPAEAPPISVAVAVVIRDLDSLAASLEGVRGQVYETSRIAVVGGGDDGSKRSAELDLPWFPTLGAVTDDLDGSVSHLWIVQSGAIARPDALRNLLEEAERVEAGIAGSKLLDRDDPERLISVGLATDVFDVPYTGLDEQEVDHGQYDVVRDVAAVAGPSMLVRRDLAKGLGGLDEKLEPQAAAIDLCQRARMRGGRVVVVPSSEVLIPRWDQGGWFAEASRIRAMIKVYDLITLLWALPARFLVGLLEAIAAPFLGRWTLFSWLRSWAWNVVHLPSTFRARLSARRRKVAGDAELFRYQLRGSADLRRIGDLTGQRLRDRLPGDDRLSIAELGKELRQPAFFVGALAVVFAAISTRTLWQGFPSVGYSLPLPDSSTSLLGSYAGGWNPGGFGSVEPLPPFVALAGAVQTILLSNPDLAAGVLIFGSFIGGMWGMVRLLRTWGVEAVPGTLAGLVLVAGPAARALAADTGLGTMVALGILPWALRIPLTRWPVMRRQKVARVLGTAWVMGLMAMANPVLLPIPVVVLLVLALVTPREGGPWRAFLVSFLGALLAVPLLLPWIGVVDIVEWLRTGAAYWVPGEVLLVAGGLVLAATVAAAPRRLSQIGGWAAIVAAFGAVLARSSDLGGGREVGHAGLAVISLGSAVLVGVVLEVVRRQDLISGWRRAAAGVGLLGAGALVVSTVLVFLPGRAGLPENDVSDALRFAAAAEGDPASSRVLLVGPADALPGESRDVLGAPYRVLTAVNPGLWELWLPETRSIDEDLDEVLQHLIDGESFRAGQDFAPFGIRWVIVLGDSPLQSVLAGQLDLVPLQGLQRPTFASEAPITARAVTDDGEPWQRQGLAYVGPPDADGRVVIAETANSRWRPDWEQTDGASSLSAADGEVSFEPISERRTQGFAALAFMVVLVGASWWGRRR